jgi:hypothetical protein
MIKKYKNNILQKLFNQAPIALFLAIIVSSTHLIFRDFFAPGQPGEAASLSTYLSLLY